MLRVYHSNQLDVLKELLAELMLKPPLANPLTEEIILVQSAGMAQWLQLALAERFNIAACIRFPLPATFIWQMFIAVLGDTPEQSPFSRTAMCWRLMDLLPRIVDEPVFHMLNQYIAHDDKQRKLFQLCQRIAALFDQYLVYRVDWITCWERGDLLNEADETERWQAALWRRLVAHTHTCGQQGVHRANLHAKFIAALDEARFDPAILPTRIFIFGISALPPIYLQVLQALGKRIDIHLLYPNPCQYYWGDIVDYAFLTRLAAQRRHVPATGGTRAYFRQPAQAPALFNTEGEQQLTNPLLASWGKLARDNLFLFAHMDLLNHDIDAFVDISGERALSYLQRDILYLEDHAQTNIVNRCDPPTTPERLLDPNDNSIVIKVCHSAVREVEVLHDHLLALFADDPDLHCRDIIVMVADIDTYAPFIQAVFSSVPPARRLPFTIADRRTSQTHPAINALFNLLSLSESRFTASDVLALLDVPVIAARFSIEQSELQLLHRWVEASGVRWGLDNEDSHALGLPMTGQHTWQFGLRRMLLGYALESDSGIWHNLLPYDDVAGSRAELVGKLASLLTCLEEWRDRLAQSYTLADWAPQCGALISAFFDVETESDAQAALMLVCEQWQQIMDEGMTSGYAAPVSILLLRDDLRSRLNQQRTSQRFLTGQINFCTFVPMRSIPFSIVCLLGMNDGVYPRLRQPESFDLIQRYPRRGDRNRRDDDRYLFLEALLSAQQQFYLSYIGCSIQDNTPRYPSIVVSELIDYLAQSVRLPGGEALPAAERAQQVVDHLLQQQSRTPFAPENFMPGAKSQSFASEWLPAALGKGIAQPEFVQPLTPYQTTEISLEQLLHFWRNPARAWFTQRLNTHFSWQAQALPEEEPFNLVGLQRYQFDTPLLDSLVAGVAAESLFAEQRAAGRLPYGAFGALFWQQRLEDLDRVAKQVIAWHAPTSSLEVELKINGVRLYGWLKKVQSTRLLRWRAAQLSMQDGLMLWIENVIWSACGGKGDSVMFGYQQSRWCFASMTADSAMTLLALLIEGYYQGLTQPLMLLNKSGGAWINDCYDRQKAALNWDQAIQLRACSALRKAWQGDDYTVGEGRAPWLNRLYRDLDEQQMREICQCAERWYLPVLQAHNDDKCNNVIR